jgi:hypothetical protein
MDHNINLLLLKSDIINNKIENSKKEYHEWIRENKKYLFPEKITKTVAYDVKVHTDKYLKYSIYINKKIEELNARPYNFLPQRNNLVPKHITINTVAMADLFPKDNKIFEYPKSELVLHSKEHQKHIWSKILKFKIRIALNLIYPYYSFYIYNYNNKIII